MKCKSCGEDYPSKFWFRDENTENICIDCYNKEHPEEFKKERSMQENLGKMSLSQILFSFTGRIGRGTFWAVWFSMMAVSLVIGLMIGGISSSGDEGAAAAGVIHFLYLILSGWVGLAMQVKRWHDRDKSGWMVLINFIPILGWLWALVELGFLQGTIGPNQYGEDPLHSTEEKSENVVQ